jgi:carbon storage regulator
MLVLTRKKSEMIRIGEDVVIKVIHAGRHVVKIGIEAPDEVRVLRAELCDPPEPGHPLAAFLTERLTIRSGGKAARNEGQHVPAGYPKAK